MNKVVVYGKKGCTFCAQTIFACLNNGIDFEYKCLDNDFTREDLESIIGTDKYTFPQIFVDETLIGGFTEFNDKLRNN